jgi:hypothetical protein
MPDRKIEKSLNILSYENNEILSGNIPYRFNGLPGIQL